MMGRPRKTFTQDVHEFVDYIKIEEDYKERTIRYYRDEGACIFSLLDGHVREGIRAKDVTKEDVFMVVDYMRRNRYAVQTMKGYICALRRICKYHGNPVPQDTKIRWPQGYEA